MKKKINSILTDLRGREVDAFYILLISSGKYTFLPELYEIFGKEATIKFLDIFAGCQISVPKVDVIEKLARNVEIYVRTEQAKSKQRASVIRDMAEEYDLTLDRVRRIYLNTKVELEDLYHFKVTKR